MTVTVLSVSQPSLCMSNDCAVNATTNQRMSGRCEKTEETTKLYLFKLPAHPAFSWAVTRAAAVGMEITMDTGWGYGDCNESPWASGHHYEWMSDKRGNASMQKNVVVDDRISPNRVELLICFTDIQ